MEYLVMETHPAFAVLLGDDGSMIKAANFGYAVGQRVTEPVLIKTESPKKAHQWKRLGGIAAAAACICLLYFGAYRPNFVPYGTVRMKINPDVLMTVSRTGRVLDLKGLNDDGDTLINGYSYLSKKEDEAAAELMETASRQGFLKDGGTVNLNVASKDGEWVSDTADNLSKTMDKGVSGKDVTIFITLGDDGKPKFVITASDGSGRIWDYDQWSKFQSSSAGNTPSASSGSSSQDIEQWGRQQGDSWEQWGEQQGDSWETFGEGVGSIFDDGFSGSSDINELLQKIKGQLG